MTGEEFMRLHANRVLRTYIITTARRRSRNVEHQNDMIQEAWLVISTAPGGYSDEAYKKLADMAIYSSYWQLNKERLMANRNAASGSSGTGYDDEQKWEIYAANQGVRRRDPTGRYI